MVAVRSPGLRVGLSRRECWLLYDWLRAQAPFVRSQLRIIRDGGTGDVSLTTQEELQEVLAAIESGGRGLEPLTPGLLALKLALTANHNHRFGPDKRRS
jgi:hypothetical protein